MSGPARVVRNIVNPPSPPPPPPAPAPAAPSPEMVQQADAQSQARARAEQGMTASQMLKLRRSGRSMTQLAEGGVQPNVGTKRLLGE